MDILFRHLFKKHNQDFQVKDLIPTVKNLIIFKFGMKS